MRNQWEIAISDLEKYPVEQGQRIGLFVGRGPLMNGMKMGGWLMKL
ncbi:hypothetical protein D3OALGA1CA_3291 [Olavius algarvensis associated proteobacterium Delta 3]|nr:hypothetical protein D3OALGB2SA_1802 [Olavius algarvensis associated proteobacterium Delta 3]CAB5132037.1 hypothetical protein D3OALGA1CA_3291 [Olavius algarvensis associated proteobacterium Delta 3]